MAAKLATKPEIRVAPLHRSPLQQSVLHSVIKPVKFRSLHTVKNKGPRYGIV